MMDWEATNTPMDLGTKLTKDETQKPVSTTLYNSLVGSLIYLTIP